MLYLTVLCVFYTHLHLHLHRSFPSKFLLAMSACTGTRVGSSSDANSAHTSESSTVNGVLLSGGLASGIAWGGGGATMALIAQVQFLQVMARIGGSKGQAGMAYFANSIGV